LVTGILLCAMPAAALAAEERAFLEGQAIPIRQVARYHCHDGAFPAIRCFRTRVARDRDTRSLAATFYVQVFEHENYGGPSFSVATAVSNLGTLGWNDRITSFKSLNGGRPRFFEHTGYGGTWWQWPAGASVPNVGSAANDRFSSVKNVP
jgi:hypothetical protein